MTTSNKGSRRPVFGTFPISVTLAVSIGLLVLVSVTSVLAIGFVTGARNTLSLLNEDAVLIVTTLEQAVRDHLEPAEAQLRFLEREVAEGRLDPTDRDRMADVMLGALAAAPQITALVYWDTDLRQISVRQDQGRPTRSEGDASRNDVARAITTAAQSTKEAFWGELLYAPGPGTTLVNRIQPIRRSGAYLGVMVTTVSMPELSFFMSDIGDMFGATAFILDGTDRVLAHPNLTSGHSDLGPESPTVAIKRIGDLVIANLPAQRPVRLDLPFADPIDLFARAAVAGVQVREVEIAESDDLFVVFERRMDDYSLHPWRIGAYLPVDVVATEIRRLAKSLLLALATLIVAIVAAVLLGRLIARPIRRVATAAQQIGALDLVHVAPLPASAIRELNDQANAFNRMLSGLRWFETYVPRSLVGRLIKRGDDVHVASSEETLTVMFTDIVDFTPLSETLSAAEIAGLLNEHFRLMAQCVEDEAGTIDKFIGDALMAFWGAPEQQPDHAQRAVRAAQAIGRGLAADNARRRDAGLFPVRIRIGIHTGPVVVGNIGAPTRMNYTIVGDAVNIGQRLEQAGKQFGRGEDTTILISADVAAMIEADDAVLDPLGEIPVKGRAQPVPVFAVRP